jgi:hypothetical protein
MVSLARPGGELAPSVKATIDEDGMASDLDARTECAFLREAV